MEELSFDVKVVNETGHRLPSGYHSRRVYLHVVVTDENGDQVFESGRIEPDGRIRGVAEDVNGASWEEHHDDDHRRLAGAGLAGDRGQDRRLAHPLAARRGPLPEGQPHPAQGLLQGRGDRQPETVENFGTFGQALSDEDFDAGEDTVSYKVSRCPRTAVQGARELRYQPLAYGHLQELFLESGRIDAVDRFRTIYDTTWKERTASGWTRSSPRRARTFPDGSLYSAP